MAAFAELVDRSRLDGTDILAVWNEDGKPVAHHSFLLNTDGSSQDAAKCWRGRLDELKD
jgi:hypothetical protein